jgi:hypothetical protein
VLNLLNRLGHPTKTQWNVRIMERYRHGAGVVTYLARYLRGGPLKNARLVAWEGDRVTFTYRVSAEAHASGTAPRSCMTLSGADFLQRWLLHVPTPQMRVVRSYGLYHHTHAEALTHCRAQVGQPPVVVPVARAGQTVCAQRGDAHPERCPAAGSSSCAWGSSRVAVRRRQRCLGSVPHDVCIAGAVCEGGGVPGARLVVSGDGRQDQRGASRVRRPRPPVPQTGAHAGATGWIPWGWLPLNSIARGGHPGQAASVRGLSNQELKLHLAVGGGVRGRDAVAARRNLTPNAFGF